MKPYTLRSEAARDDLLAPEEILLLSGKARRDALHRAVNAFFADQGIRCGGEFDASRCRRAVDQYLRIYRTLKNDQCARAAAAIPEDRFAASERLSTPEVYREIRQAGHPRSRRDFPELSPAGLLEVCARIRAALIWRCLTLGQTQSDWPKAA